MRFREKSKQVDAFRLSEPLKTEQGDVIADAGDWIALEDGQQVIYKAEMFAAKYEAVQSVQC